jgi:hypothetical protein
MASRAAYMRDYRAKRKAAPVQPERPSDGSASVDEPWASIRASNFREIEAEAVLRLTAENARLVEDAHRLKRALAQCQRDAILHKINRTKN